ncbi:hypothetical protein N9U15_01985 [Prochlorococcus sp. AH-736-P13]|nr:hypothetical protein [Prochlorococcus sp. AH-736-P13]MDA9693751.1 hypothetical protein [Prochlorococcus sp. AH-736-P13]
MRKSLKRFLLYLLSDFSKSFSYLQAKFHEVLKDSIFSRFNCLKINFKIIRGNINLSKEFVDYTKYNLENESIPRSHNKTASLSKSFNYEEIPDCFKDIIKDNRRLIKSYLGNKIVYDSLICWRLFHFNKEFEGFDVFSNVWHQDSHDGNRLLKIFLLIEEVREKDGPFHWINEKNTKKNWDSLVERWTFNNFKETKSYQEQDILTGEKGDYLILDTSRCMHRDSNPIEKRDIASITLYPGWRKNKDRRYLDLSKL